jgi:hypothetical protein
VGDPDFVYHREGDFWIGWFAQYPDYRTRGATLAELEENMRELGLALATPRFVCGDIGSDPASAEPQSAEPHSAGP